MRIRASLRRRSSCAWRRSVMSTICPRSWRAVPAASRTTRALSSTHTAWPSAATARYSQRWSSPRATASLAERERGVAVLGVDQPGPEARDPPASAARALPRTFSAEGLTKENWNVRGSASHTMLPIPSTSSWKPLLVGADLVAGVRGGLELAGVVGVQALRLERAAYSRRAARVAAASMPPMPASDEGEQDHAQRQRPPRRTGEVEAEETGRRPRPGPRRPTPGAGASPRGARRRPASSEEKCDTGPGTGLMLAATQGARMEPFRPDLLAGKTTIITGGGSGLGRSMALRMAGLGASVAVLGRRPAPLEETAREIREKGGRGGRGALRHPRPGSGPLRGGRGGAGAGPREPAREQRGGELPGGIGGPLAQRLQLRRADRALRHLPLHARGGPPPHRAQGRRARSSPS